MNDNKDPVPSGDYLLAEALNKRGDYLTKVWHGLPRDTKTALTKVCMLIAEQSPEHCPELTLAEKTIAFMRLVLDGRLQLLWDGEQDEEGISVRLRVTDPAPPALIEPFAFSPEDMEIVRLLCGE